MNTIQRAIEALEGAMCLTLGSYDEDCISNNLPTLNPEVVCRRCAALAELRRCEVVEGEAIKDGTSDPTSTNSGVDVWTFSDAHSDVARRALLILLPEEDDE